MIDKDDGIVDMDLRFVAVNCGRVTIVKINIRQSAFDRGVNEINAPPESASRLARESDMGGISPFSQQLTVYREGGTGAKINGRPGLNAHDCPRWNCCAGVEQVRAARR